MENGIEVQTYWYKKNVPIFGEVHISDQPWLNLNDDNPAYYEIMETDFGLGISLTFFHGNRGFEIATRIKSVNKAKELANKHLQGMLDGIIKTSEQK